MAIYTNMPAQTGLSQLGDALLRGSGDYANIQLRKQEQQRQLELEQMRRQQALGDLQDQRKYSEGQFEQQRTARLGDAKTMAAMNNRFESLQLAEKLGLIAAKDIGNMPIEDIALSALSQRMGVEDTRKTEMRNRAQARADQNAVRQEAIMQSIARDEAVANSEPTIDESQIRQIQERLARSANPKAKQVSEGEISEQYDAALALYEKDALNDWFKRSQEAKVNAQNNKILLQGLARENAALSEQYGVVGDVPRNSPVAPAAVNAVTRAPPIDPLAAFRGQLDAERKKRGISQPSTRDFGAASVFNDINSATQAVPASVIPEFRQARTDALADEYGRLDAPLFKTNEQLGEAQGRLQRILGGFNPFQSVTPSALPSGVGGELLAQFILESQALQNQQTNQQNARSQGRSRLLSQLKPLPVLSPRQQETPASVFGGGF